MAGEKDSEKRFQSIMNKLFQSPRSKTLTSSPGSENSRGKKREGSVMETESNHSSRSIVTVGGLKRSANRSGLPSEAPLCRPWDRGDLLRRLATFKSMSWFGKPKAVSAVNCARRGWINVEMDIIACEACGARLLFSTPSSWTHQQIEKAAAVFSLKLDSGHKLLCPWINNSCEETLAQFPPTTAPALVDGYRERSFALLRLSALPKVSSAVIEYMRSPQLEHFLEQSSTLELGLEFADSYTIQSSGTEHGAVSPDSYYQAQKLIALCGWETRSLPYVVDFERPTAQSESNAHPVTPMESSARVVNGRNPGIIMCSRSDVDGQIDIDEEQRSLNGLQSDPASVVLECRLCGASVGLWAFSVVQRPLELYRLTGSTEVATQKNPTTSGFANSCASGTSRSDDLGSDNHVSSSGDPRSLNLNLSIAGGPPPAKQNYRARVSLPIISRHLRAGLSSNSDVRDHGMSKTSHSKSALCDSENFNSIQLDKDQTENSVSMQIVRPEDMGSLKRKRTEGVDLISRGDDPLCVHSENSKVDPVTDDKNSDSSSQSREYLGVVSDASPTDGNVEISKNLPSTTDVVEACHPQQDKDFSGNEVLTSEATHDKSLLVAPCPQPIDSASITGETNLREGNNGEFIEKSLEVEATKQKLEGAKSTMQLSVSNGFPASHGLGKRVDQAQLDQTMEFDPIRQHRHFCPWIITSGSAAPGWQQTLHALAPGKEPSHLPVTKPPSSTSMLEMDDPITSIRNLFMSPSSSKRKKLTQGSS